MKKSYEDEKDFTCKTFQLFWYNFGMKYEYDDNKNSINQQKHGISFDEAQRLWHDENMLEVPLDFADEKRFLCIGMIEDRHYSAITTYRQSHIRIISVRRARKEEIFHYENSERI